MSINIILTFFESNIYLFLLVIPFLAQLGIPTGAMFFILFAGALTSNISELFFPFIITLFSTVTGDITAYFIGKKLIKSIFIQSLLKNKKVEYLFSKSKKYFNKRGTIAIFLSRFLITGIGPTINYLVGFQSFKLKKFTFNIFIGEILYSAELLILGYFFKDTFVDVFNIISNFGFVILLMYILYKIGKKLIKHNKFLS